MGSVHEKLNFNGEGGKLFADFVSNCTVTLEYFMSSAFYSQLLNGSLALNVLEKTFLMQDLR